MIVIQTTRWKSIESKMDLGCVMIGWKEWIKQSDESTTVQRVIGRIGAKAPPDQAGI